MLGKQFNIKYKTPTLIIFTDQFNINGLQKIQFGLNCLSNDIVTDRYVFPFDGYYCDFKKNNTPYNHNYFTWTVTIPDNACVFLMTIQDPCNSDKTIQKIKTNMIQVSQKIMTFTVENFENIKHFSLYSVPKKLRTEQLCKKFVERFGNNLQYVPEQFKTLEMSIIAIRDGDVNWGCDYPRAILFVRDDIMSYDLCILSLYHGTSFRRVNYPQEYQTYDFFKIAIQNHVCTLRTAPEEYQCNELCEIAMKSGNNLNEVMIKYRSNKICQLSIEHGNGNNLKDTNIHFITHKTCIIAAKNGCELINIPEKYRDEEICKLTALHVGKYEFLKTFRLFPKKFRTFKMIQNILTNKKQNAFFTWTLTTSNYNIDCEVQKYIIEDFLSEEIFTSFEFRQFCQEIPETTWNDKLCDYAIKHNPMSIEYIPTKFITKKRIKYAFTCGFYMPWNRYFNSFPYSMAECELYVKNGGDIDDIPKEFFSPKIWLINS